MIYLLDSAPRVGKSIISSEIKQKHTEANEHDWLRGASDQYLCAFSMFVRRMSTFIEQETKKYGFEYFEMDGELFGDAAEKIMKSLGLKAR